MGNYVSNEIRDIMDESSHNSDRERSNAPSPEPQAYQEQSDNQSNVAIGSKRRADDNEESQSRPIKRQKINDMTSIDTEHNVETEALTPVLPSSGYSTSDTEPYDDSAVYYEPKVSVVDRIRSEMIRLDPMLVGIPIRIDNPNYEIWYEYDDPQSPPVIYYRSLTDLSIPADDRISVLFDPDTLFSPRNNEIQLMIQIDFTSLEITPDMRYALFRVERCTDSDFDSNCSSSYSESSEETIAKIYDIFIFDIEKQEVVDKIYDVQNFCLLRNDSIDTDEWTTILYSTRDNEFTDLREYDFETLTDRTLFTVREHCELFPDITATHDFVTLTKVSSDNGMSEVYIAPISNYSTQSSYRLVRAAEPNISYSIDSVTFRGSSDSDKLVLIMLETDTDRKLQRLLYANPNHTLWVGKGNGGKSIMPTYGDPSLVFLWTEFLSIPIDQMEITSIHPIYEYLIFEYTNRFGKRVGYYPVDPDFTGDRIIPMSSLEFIEQNLDSVHSVTLADNRHEYYSQSDIRIIRESPLSARELIEVSLDYDSSVLTEDNFELIERSRTTEYEPELYENRQIRVPFGNASITMTMAYRSDRSDLIFGENSEPVPTLIMAYDTTIEPTFNHHILPLMKEGYLVCMVHPIAHDLTQFTAYDENFCSYVWDCAAQVAECISHLQNQNITRPEFTVVHTINETGALMRALIATSHSLFSVGLIEARYGDSFVYTDNYRPPQDFEPGSYPNTYLLADIHDQERRGIDSLIEMQNLIKRADPTSIHVVAPTYTPLMNHATMYGFAIESVYVRFGQSVGTPVVLNDTSNDTSESFSPSSESPDSEPVFLSGENYYSYYDSDGFWDTGYDSV